MKPEQIWELDFHPCPLLDEEGKRVWELLLCDSTGTWQHHCYASNQEVNSRWVSERLQEYLAVAPSPPLLVRIFRMRMAALLQRATELVGIPHRLSRRVYALNRWYQERQQQVYPHETAYTYKLDPMPSLEFNDPLPLPDALRGERWAFVTLRASDFQEAEAWAKEFGEMLPIAWSQLDPKTVIPGLVLTSVRARAMAAWMSGVDPYAVVIEEGSPPELLLQIGATDGYSLARLTDDKSRAEANGFSQRVADNGGLHFLAVQESLQSQSFAGFWLLCTLPLEG